MMATTAPTRRGTIDKSDIIHALDKHSGLPQCNAKVVSSRFVTAVMPDIPVDTPRAELAPWITCKPCLREMGAPPA
jgi:hypothetical protein